MRKAFLKMPWLCVALVLISSTAVGAGEFIVPKTKRAGDLIPNQYIVHFVPGSASGAQSMASQLAATHGAKTLHVYDALDGAAYQMNENAARAMANNPNVLFVEQDVMFTIDASGNQSNPPAWGIDRIDERTLPDDNNYHWDFSGDNVVAFVLDTGILTSHSNFAGRASFGIDCTGEGAFDGNGHGTHVAGSLGSETYGVAKDVNLVAVKVCTSGGSCPGSATSCGINFVINQKNSSPNTPMVANMSLGGPFSQSSNNGVAAGVASGVFFAVAAGNNNSNACNFSPASEPTAYTIGSTTQTDARSSFSNFGTCVDIFAPGSSILSTWNNGGTNTISGTSMASPHAAGAGALVLSQHPTWTPAQVANELNARGTTGVLSGIGAGSPNRLLYTIDDTGTPPPPPPPPPPTCNNQLHFANFENGGADGWTQGNSSCSTGDFVVGNPDPESNGGVTTQPNGSASGNGSFFTAPNPGGAGSDDVDGGTCEALSPVISASGTVTISLDYFHGQRDAGDDAADGFVIDVINNGVVVGSMVNEGDITTNAVWTSDTATLSNAGNVQLRVRATDGAATGDLVEGGIDNVQICGDSGTPPPPPPPGGCDVDIDFESGAAGWSNSGASTCSTGAYVLGNPTQVTNGGVVTQVGGSNSGVNSVFTATNSSAGVNDVDGGNCVLDSPTWSVGSSSTLSVAYWHGQRDSGGDPNGDFFILEYSLNGGATWNTMVSNGDSTSNASWSTATAQIPGGSNVALRVQCSDGPGSGDLVECGIDDVMICDN